MFPLFLSVSLELSCLHMHVLGIWTDGTWAFSTGLDQRVRCWKMESSAKFTEYSHAIISVPEPETLDVFHDRWACLYNVCAYIYLLMFLMVVVVFIRAKTKYQIAVAGRGMQMVEFSPPEDDCQRWCNSMKLNGCGVPCACMVYGSSLVRWILVGKA